MIVNDPVADTARACELRAMIRGYHHGLVARAEKAVSTGSIFTVLSAMQREAAIWALPALVAVAICWVFGLSGSNSLWISLPLVGITILGSGAYVCTVYVQAMARRKNGD